MAWTCTECGESDPFDPPRTNASGEALCLTCAQQPSYGVTD